MSMRARPRPAVGRRSLLVLSVVVSMLAIAAPASAARLGAGPSGEGRESGAAPRGTFEGVMRADGQGVVGGTVRLWAAGSTPTKAALLRTVTTGPGGAFSIAVPPAAHPSAVLYVTGAGGRIGGRVLAATVELAASLGDLRSGPIVLDERTTVAAGYALAQFADAGAIGGPKPGLPNAARMPRNLVDPRTGAITRFFGESPNGPDTEALTNFESLASIIAGCAAGTNDCDAFLTAATDPWGVRPATTWQAMTLLPTNPAGDALGVFDQIPADPRFEPVRTDVPSAWTIALRFYGNGRQFNGPGNIAFDSAGRVWSNNNTEWSERREDVCPGLEIYHLDPYAHDRPMATYTGGGLNGAGFGIALDPKQHVWVANYGFTGGLCQGPPPTSNSVSEFKPSGKPVSGDLGYLQGPLSWPQGIKSDRDGDMFIASCGNGLFVEYPKGNPRKARVVGSGLGKPFDMAVTTNGTIVVTANAEDAVHIYGPDGVELRRSPFGDESTMPKPMGAASDTLGNVWVSASGVVNIPCSPSETLETPADEPRLHGSIALVGPAGAVTRFDGAGMTIPWGIAVDGDDNLWVANFSGQRLSHLCGARASTCPLGSTGAAISPDDGYSFDGLQRNTGVQIDPSGNVWLANNWDNVPQIGDPFGDGLVVFLGLAEPVAAPLIGPPQQP